MKYSTGQKKKSRLQGHRKRRRTPEIIQKTPQEKINWTEYKTVRQYRSIGDMLDEFKVYGFRGGVENLIQRDEFANENGYNWLTKESNYKA